MITIAFLIVFCMLVTSNAAWMVKVQNIRINAPVKVEYKEVEVVKKAMCECSHVSSFHKNGDGTCQALTFFTDGGKVKLSKSIECPCHKYTGPMPEIDYFDAKLRELESHRE